MGIAILTASSIQAQTRVEYFWDTDPGVGKATLLRSSAEETMQLEYSIPTNTLPKGIHQMVIRAVNASVGQPYYVTRSVLVTDEKTESVQEVEYYWDTDPGVGKGKKMNVSGNDGTIAIDQSLDCSMLSNGMHTLGIRAKSQSNWSCTYVSQYCISDIPTQNVERIEYYWDTDPGLGKGVAIPFTTSDKVVLNTTLSSQGLSNGSHQLNIRARSENAWSTVYSTTVLVETIESNEVSLLEYFWDEDPGVGKGEVISVPAGQQGMPFAIDLNTSDLSGGVHKLGLRAKAGKNWSQTETRTFLIDTEGLVTRIEYFWDDEDPGLGNAIPLDVKPAHEIKITDLVLPLTGLSYEYHTLNIRAMSESDTWTETQRIPVNNVKPEGEYSIEVTYTAGGSVSASSHNVFYGDDVTFIVTPSEGYEVESITLNGTDVTSIFKNGLYTLKGITANQKLHATFKPLIYAVQISRGSNGMVSADVDAVAYDQSVTFTITPNEGYMIDKVLYNGSDVTNKVKNGKYTVSNVQGEVHLSATFKIAEFNISVVCGAGGIVTASAQFVNYGENVMFTITPDEGRKIDSVILNEVDITSDVVDGQYTLNNVKDHVVLVVTFGSGDIAMEISCSEGCKIQINDVMLGSGELNTLIPYGSDMTIRLFTEQGYDIAFVTIDGGDVTSKFENNTYVIHNVTEHKNIKVVARRISYHIEVIGSEGGTIIASSTTMIPGGSVSFTLSPNERYEVVSVIMNGEDITYRFINGTYTIESVRTDITIQATFTSVTAINSVYAKATTVKTVKDGILVNNAPIGKQLIVYTMAGLPINSVIISEGDFLVTIPLDKAYIIKIDDKIFKVVL